jgi:hypothetical protein
MHSAPDYLNPDLPANLRIVRMPVVEATDQSLRGYGFIVDDPKTVKIEIVRWPATGRRPVDPDSGDATNVSRSPKSEDRYPCWSPDGRRIAFTRHHRTQGGAFEADGSIVQKKTGWRDG